MHPGLRDQRSRPSLCRERVAATAAAAAAAEEGGSGGGGGVSSSAKHQGAQNAVAAAAAMHPAADVVRGLLQFVVTHLSRPR